jgi:Ig-like domain from next to BRCA1 gene
MKHLPKITALLLALGLLALSACGGGAAVKPTVDAAPIYTQLASTALAFQAQTAAAKPATNTPQVSPTPEVTNTLLSTEPSVTNTPVSNTPLAGTPSVTARAQTTPKATSQASCDNMQYVADVTYADGTIVGPGEYMIKTWTVKNLGPCAWNKNFTLAFGWGGVGTDWATIGPANLTKDVNVGETIDISVGLEAPKTKGTYGAYFVMQNDKGVNFPSQPLTIFITVQ